ncbi:MAG: hypothetical protein Q9177_003119 [Variospora cf. flavescens]
MKNTVPTILSHGSRPRLYKCCFAARKRYISTTPLRPTSLPPPAPSSGFAHLSNRALISINGQDAAHYLQGLTTANIKTSPSSSSSQSGFYSAFLNAQGRVLHDVFVYPSHHAAELRGESHGEPSFLIDVDKAHVETLRAHLKRYKLRAKIQFRVVDSGERDVWATWGGDDGAVGNTANLGSQDVGCTDTRAPDMGQRVITYAGGKPTISSGEETPVESYDIRRILKGVPQGQSEILSGEALPQESNIDYMGGIDFRKGCYVGQELTIRTHHTGVVRKRILPVQLYSIEDEKPPDTLQYNPQSLLELPLGVQNISRVNTRGRSAGKWLTGVGNIGLALCRLETMTDVRLTEEGSQWSPEHEFKMSWHSEGDEERQLKIKAFVPDWHRNRPTVRDMHRQPND